MRFLLAAPLAILLATTLPPLATQRALAENFAPQPTATADAPDSAAMFRSSSSLILVNVFVEDRGRPKPLATLDREDFEVLMDGKPAPIVVFDRAASSETRPMALWFVLVCHQKGALGKSTFLKGEARQFQSALRRLESRDTVGVAHWCGDGTQAIDLDQTLDRDAPIAAIEKLLHEKPLEATKDPQEGESALKKTVHLLLEQTRQHEPSPLPVLVFLYTDETKISRETAVAIKDESLQNNAVVYGITELGTWPRSAISLLCFVTAGHFFTSNPQYFGSALEDISMRLHARYEIGIKPPTDRRQHNLVIKLSAAAQHKYPLGHPYYYRRDIDLSEP